MTKIDKEAVITACEEVRSDNSETTWLTLKFSGNVIELDSTGADYDDFLSQFTHDDRKFGYVRVVTGDEMSKRSKFVFITWSGSDVSPMQKAKLGVDKSEVKNVLRNYAIEIMAEDLNDISLEAVKDKLNKAGGANYGTGVA